MLVSMIMFLDACCVLYIDSFTRCLFLWFAISSTDLSDSSTYRKFSASYTDLVADVLSKAEKFLLCVFYQNFLENGSLVAGQVSLKSRYQTLISRRMAGGATASYHRAER